MAKIDQEELSSSSDSKRKPITQKSASIDTPGRITTTIGTGENAKDSIAYLTIRYAFIAGIALSIILIINKWFITDNKEGLIDEIKSCWQIIIPIITLVLGYYFGKSGSKASK